MGQIANTGELEMDMAKPLLAYALRLRKRKTEQRWLLDACTD
jgi:hypothetical protein